MIKKNKKEERKKTMAELKRTYGSFEAIGILSLYGKTVEEKTRKFKQNV